MNVSMLGLDVGGNNITAVRGQQTNAGFVVKGTHTYQHQGDPKKINNALEREYGLLDSEVKGDASRKGLYAATPGAYPPVDPRQPDRFVAVSGTGNLTPFVPLATAKNPVNMGDAFVYSIHRRLNLPSPSKVLMGNDMGPFAQGIIQQSLVKKAMRDLGDKGFLIDGGAVVSGIAAGTGTGAWTTHARLNADGTVSAEEVFASEAGHLPYRLSAKLIQSLGGQKKASDLSKEWLLDGELFTGGGNKEPLSNMHLLMARVAQANDLARSIPQKDLTPANLPRLAKTYPAFQPLLAARAAVVAENLIAQRAASCFPALPHVMVAAAPYVNTLDKRTTRHIILNAPGVDPKNTRVVFIPDVGGINLKGLKAAMADMGKKMLRQLA